MRHGVFGILAAVSFLIALIIWVVNPAHPSHLGSYITFALLGLLLLAVHESWFWYRRGVPA
jgi:FtsH-binding integral membrane protein